jgi:hypothetical protein
MFDKFVTSFTITSPRARHLVFLLDAVRAAGHRSRLHPTIIAQGKNAETGERFEVWQTTMPLEQFELLVVEVGQLVIDVMPSSEVEQ